MTALSNESSGEIASRVGVMVVDDHLSFRRVAQAVIDATVGFEWVGGASSGSEALRYAAELRPSLVLVDVRMPEMGGVEAARRLTELHPDAVVVLVSLGELHDASAALASCGAVAFMRKQDFGTTMLQRLWTIHHPSMVSDSL